LWSLCLNDLLDGDLCEKMSLISIFSLFFISNTILSDALIISVSQVQTQQLMTSQIRTHTEYLIQTYHILVLSPSLLLCVCLTSLCGGWPPFCKSDDSAWRSATFCQTGCSCQLACRRDHTSAHWRLSSWSTRCNRAVWHKYVDATTMTEFLSRSAVSSMQMFVDELVQQATDVGMIVNGRKTKELLIGSVIKDPPPPVERVTTCKLLGVHVKKNQIKLFYSAPKSWPESWPT